MFVIISRIEEFNIFLQSANQVHVTGTQRYIIYVHDILCISGFEDFVRRSHNYSRLHEGYI